MLTKDEVFLLQLNLEKNRSKDSGFNTGKGKDINKKNYCKNIDNKNQARILYIDSWFSERIDELPVEGSIIYNPLEFITDVNYNKIIVPVYAYYQTIDNKEKSFNFYLDGMYKFRIGNIHIDGSKNSSLRTNITKIISSIEDIWKAFFYTLEVRIDELSHVLILKILNFSLEKIEKYKADLIYKLSKKNLTKSLTQKERLDLFNMLKFYENFIMIKLEALDIAKLRNLIKASSTIENIRIIKTSLSI